jgi:signal transduction histidine kinase
MQLSFNKLSSIVFLVFLWAFVTFFMFFIVLDTSISITGQLFAVIIATTLCLPVAWYIAQKLVPRYIYNKRISTFILVVSAIIIISSVSILMLSLLILQIVSNAPFFRSYSITFFLIFVTLFVNIIFTSIACVGRIMYDRYYIEEKMLDAIKEKITSEYLLMEEKKQKQRELKEQEEKERKRIAAELHDNLGVQANAILHNSTLLNLETENNKNIVTNLQDTAKEMLVNLRETLWAMKTTDVTATDLWLRVINFMKQMGRHYNHVNFELQGTPPKEFIIPSKKALNIVLVLQETINNAVKHSEAKKITAKSIISNTSWQVLIEDDGKGFELEKAKQKDDSYGLTNMQERAKAGGFIYAVESVLQKGTTAFITITE